MAGSGRTVIEAGGTLNMPTRSVVTEWPRAGERRNCFLDGYRNLVMNPPAAITNRPGALFEIRNATPITANNGFVRIDNAARSQNRQPGITIIPRVSTIPARWRFKPAR